MRALSLTRSVAFIALVTALTACSSQPGDASGSDRNPASPTASETVSEITSPDAATATPATPATPGTPGTPAKLPVSLPKLTYAYALSYMLPGDKIAAAQDAHRSLCDEMGPARCQLLALERGVGEEESNHALLKLRVATSESRRFQVLLDHDVTEAGGRAETAKIGTDEVSKQIVDAEARIHQRELLVGRLTQILRTRNAKASELLEVERNVTQAQEELDQARGWLGELKGRVAMSEFDIRYAAIAPSATSRSVAGQLGEAAQGSGAVFLIGLRFFLSLFIYLLPWLALLALPVFAIRALRRRRLPTEA
ncbi:DUF4349 domain-containing protein [Sphingomonas sp. LM7]|uniref:DUF4349 domain-containing protein n=1 Tax=Sphingomonas sp. LM7 TaxID=1938607 RepID=UPI00098390D6|nr:DUF4349 domain-containing protein [Sphingomonas sp. LM7]AQR72658.1 hypothetical protein BXU08_02325 [Sphingomonas sp. LM7]